MAHIKFRQINGRNAHQKLTKHKNLLSGDELSHKSSKTGLLIKTKKITLLYTRSKVAINTGKLKAFVTNKGTVVSGIALSLAIICNAYSSEFKEFLGDVRSVCQKIIQYVLPNHGIQTGPVVPPVETPKKQNPHYDVPEGDRRPYELREENNPKLQHTNTDKATMPSMPSRQEIITQLTNGFKNAARKGVYLKSYSFKNPPSPVRSQAGLVLRAQHRAAM